MINDRVNKIEVIRIDSLILDEKMGNAPARGVYKSSMGDREGRDGREDVNGRAEKSRGRTEEVRKSSQK